MPGAVEHIYNLNPAAVKRGGFRELTQCGVLYEKCPT